MVLGYLYIYKMTPGRDPYDETISDPGTKAPRQSVFEMVGLVFRNPPLLLLILADTIRGERKFDQTVADDRYYRRERAFGTFQRSFATHTIISPGEIKATFKNGVLKVEVPKPQEIKPKQVSVNIE